MPGMTVGGRRTSMHRKIRAALAVLLAAALFTATFPLDHVGRALETEETGSAVPDSTSAGEESVPEGAVSIDDVITVTEPPVTEGSVTETELETEAVIETEEASEADVETETESVTPATEVTEEVTGEAPETEAITPWTFTDEAGTIVESVTISVYDETAEVYTAVSGEYVLEDVLGPFGIYLIEADGLSAVITVAETGITYEDGTVVEEQTVILKAPAEEGIETESESETETAEEETETASEEVTEEQTEEITEDATEETSEQETARPETETEEVTETMTEPVTESETPTEAVTEGETEDPTESRTERDTEVQTEAPAETAAGPVPAETPAAEPEVIETPAATKAPVVIDRVAAQAVSSLTVPETPVESENEGTVTVELVPEKEIQGPFADGVSASTPAVTVDVVLPEGAEVEENVVSLDSGNVTVDLAPVKAAEGAETNVTEHDSHLAFAEALVGVELTDTGRTMDFYNTFVNEETVKELGDAGHTISDIFSYTEDRDELYFLSLDPMMQVETSPVYAGADGYYYAVSNVPTMQGLEELDHQAANSNYVLLAGSYPDVECLGKGVYRMSAERYEELFTEQTTATEEAVATYILGLRIQVLYASPDTDATYKTVGAKVEYPDGTTTDTIALVDTMNATASVQLFAADADMSTFTNENYEVGVDINAGQFLPDGSAFDSDTNTLSFLAGDPAALSSIKVSVKSLKRSAALDGAALLGAGGGMQLMAASMTANNAIKLTSVVPAGLKVGDTFVYQNKQVLSVGERGGWMNQAYEGGPETYHPAANSVETRFAQYYISYPTSGDGMTATSSWFKNSLSDPNADPADVQNLGPSISLVQMTDQGIQDREDKNRPNNCIGHLFGYLSEGLTSVTNGNGQTLDLEGTRLLTACMHAWAYESPNTPAQVIEQVRLLTGRDDVAEDVWQELYPNIALQCYNTFEENGVIYADFKVCTSLLGVPGAYENNKQVGFATVRLAWDKPYGFAVVQKSSSNTAITSGNSNYSMNGIVYRLYTDAVCTTRATDANGAKITLTLDAFGKSNTVELPAGTYYAKEYMVPTSSNYQLSNAVTTVTVTPGQTATASVTDAPITGYISAQKVSSNTTITNGNANYNFGGIQFKAYTNAACTVEAKNTAGQTFTLTTGANGITSAVNVPLGTYWIREVESSLSGKGWVYNPNPVQINVTASHTYAAPARVSIVNNPENGYLRVHKTSAQPVMTEGNPCYTFSGIQFKVYTNAACTAEAKNTAGQTFTLTTGTNAYTPSVNLPIGTYYIREVASSLTGKGWDQHNMPAVATVTVTANHTSQSPLTKDIANNALNDPAGIEIRKEAAYGGVDESLAGAQFTLKYYAGQYTLDTLPVEANATWVIETKEKNGVYRAFLSQEFVVSGSPVYGSTPDGDYTIPLGTLTIEETKAPEGFKIEGGTLDIVDAVGTTQNGIALFNLVDENSTAKVKVGNVLSDAGEGIVLRMKEVPEPKIETQAHDSETGTNVAMPDEDVTIIDTVSFKDLVIGESYILSAVLIDQATEEPVLDDNGEEITAEVELVPETTDGTVDVTLEFPGVTLSAKTVVCFEYLLKEGVEVAAHAKIDAPSQTIFFPEIHTTATAEDTEDHVTAADDEIVLTDRVFFENLSTDHTYVMHATLVDASNGNPIIIDGEELVAETEFQPKERSGYVDVTFEFDNGAALAGTKTIIFEDCLLNGVVVCTHSDVNDEGQAIYIPGAATKATDAKTEIDHTLAEPEAMLTDRVFYTALLPDREYTVNALLLSKETGEPFLDAEGKEITGTTTFSPAEPDGYVDVEVSFSAELLRGDTILIFEDILLGEKLVCWHHDLGDESQTDYVPEIHTTATDSETKDHIALADEEVTIHDVVRYEGLKPETKYVLVGVLMDGDTEKPMLDAAGKEIRSSVTFMTGKAEMGKVSVSGEVTVPFTFDASLAENKRTIVFEDLYQSEKLVAQHADIHDEGQQIVFPRIRTTAMVPATGTQTAIYSETTVIQDEVRFEGLIPNKTYHLVGTLMDRETEKPVEQEGKVITAEAELTPAESSGTAILEFVVDTTLLVGKTCVIYESVLSNGVCVGLHADIQDTPQTVYVPEIKTMATDKASGTKTMTVTSITELAITDVIEYHNLTPGMTVRMEGEIYDKATGESIGIKAETEFIVEEPSGTAEVEFAFRVDDLFEGDLVVFEKCYDAKNNVLLAVHENLEDEGQTVKVVIPKGSADVHGPKYKPVPQILGITGSYTGVFGTGLLLVAAVILLVVLKRRNKAASEPVDSR